MKRKIQVAAALVLSIIFVGVSDSHACTYFFLKAKDGSVISTRTDEFFSESNSKLELVPRGSVFTSTAPENARAVTWRTKYGFIAISVNEELIGKGFDEGMNEKGLATGGLWFGDVKYPAIETGDEVVNLLDFVAWVLGNFQTVAEVKEALPKIKIWASDQNIFEVVMPMHFYVTDAVGDSIVVEYIEGNLKMWDNKANGVMTNEPDLGWHLNNLRFYSNMSPRTPTYKEPCDAIGNILGGVKWVLEFMPEEKDDTWSLGTGLLGLPGDYTDASRFVRISKLKQFSPMPEDAKAGVILAHHLIDTVDIPFGPQVWIQGGLEFPQWTVWTVIYDHAHRHLYYHTYDNTILRRFDLGKINFSEGQPRKTIEIFGGTGYIDETDRWSSPAKKRK